MGTKCKILCFALQNDGKERNFTVIHTKIFQFEKDKFTLKSQRDTLNKWEGMLSLSVNKQP